MNVSFIRNPFSFALIKISGATNEVLVDSTLIDSKTRFLNS